MQKNLAKEERRAKKALLRRYHQKVTEDAFLPLYEDFQKWRNGELPYGELTEKIPEFHQLNQKIWTRFNYNGAKDHFLVIEAKNEFGLLSAEEKEEYAYWLEN